MNTAGLPDAGLAAVKPAARQSLSISCAWESPSPVDPAASPGEAITIAPDALTPLGLGTLLAATAITYDDTEQDPL